VPVSEDLNRDFGETSEIPVRPVGETAMDDYALVLNAGSSSLKFCVYRRPLVESWRFEARGQIEDIGSSPRLSVKDSDGRSLGSAKLDEVVHNGREALDALAGWLRSRYGGARVLGVGHRVVHGGARFTGPTVVDRQVLAELYELVPLAPLHQPYNLAAIEAVFDRLPDVPQVACFDTSFHRGHSAVADVIPLPRDICDTGLQRYGFHGLSYEYIASVLPQEAPEIARGRVIVAHLGSGASLCALKDGKSVDSSFGFTALDGLCMGTRPGAIDPGALLYLLQTLSLSPREVETILYKRSGLLGISGISNDMRVLLARNEPEALLAVDYFVYRAAKEIGALAAVLGGIDGLVFTAGIGENSPEIRRRICEASAWLGIELDATANNRRATRISKPQSKVSAWVVPTNEELMIARHTGTILGLSREPQVEAVGRSWHGRQTAI
jgi:acetate kinase